MQDQAPTIIVILSALAINLRMAMYSASITPYLGGLPLWKRAIAAYFLVDQTYACAVLEYEKQPHMPLRALCLFHGGNDAHLSVLVPGHDCGRAAG